MNEASKLSNHREVEQCRVNERSSGKFEVRLRQCRNTSMSVFETPYFKYKPRKSLLKFSMVCLFVYLSVQCSFSLIHVIRCYFKTKALNPFMQYLSFTVAWSVENCPIPKYGGLFVNFSSGATLLYTPLCPSVHPSIRRLVSLLLPRCSSDLKYGPYPPARDWVAVYPAMIQFVNAFHITALT